MNMNSSIYKQFANALLSLVPDFPMDTQEIETYVRTQGLGSFVHEGNCHAAALAETVRLLSCLEAGGVNSEQE